MNCRAASFVTEHLWNALEPELKPHHVHIVATVRYVEQDSYKGKEQKSLRFSDGR